LRKRISNKDLQAFLEEKYLQYNHPGFIPDDPVSIPHLFNKKQDIEIMGFWAATLAWGQRKTIINKCRELISLMENSPYEFIRNHKEKDLKRFLKFKHRTFNATDTLYFIAFFKKYYSENDTLENAFSVFLKKESRDVGEALNGFHNLFFSLEDCPDRTRKHVAAPMKNSACKRLNMFLRWMVRKDKRGVDFGIWKKIRPSQLVCPCDVHVEKVARRLGLIKRKGVDWHTAVELTGNLKEFDPEDPVKYDFALFGMGVENNFEF
jgi:uncharacterized protein (TIGR02757 family)